VKLTFEKFDFWTPKGNLWKCMDSKLLFCFRKCRASTYVKNNIT